MKGDIIRVKGGGDASVLAADGRGWCSNVGKEVVKRWGDRGRYTRFVSYSKNDPLSLCSVLYIKVSARAFIHRPEKSKPKEARRKAST